MIFENSSLKGIFGQNLSDPPEWSLTDDSRFLQAAILIILQSYYRYMCITSKSMEISMYGAGRKSLMFLYKSHHANC